jgi:hypothetical protein
VDLVLVDQLPVGDRRVAADRAEDDDPAGDPLGGGQAGLEGGAAGVADGDLAVSPAGVDAIARYYTTVVQGLSIQARDGASRAELETVIGCAMAAWDALAAGPAAS